jgi:hypothetical protein
MAKAKKEGKKKRSRKSILKTLKLVDHNNKILNALKVRLEKN